jgi:transposase
MTSPAFVGVDVAKERWDVAVQPSGERWSGANDETGITALVARLRPLSPALIVCEATGGFERAAIAALAAAGLPVVVANPRQVRDFARATGQLAKTDQVDAGILALFAERVRPTPRPLPDDAAQLLDAVLTRRRQLLEMLTAEKNRLGFAPKPLHRGIQAHIRWLERQLDDVTKELATWIEASPVWRGKDPGECANGALHGRAVRPALEPGPEGVLRPVDCGGEPEEGGDHRVRPKAVDDPQRDDAEQRPLAVTGDSTSIQLLTDRG